MEGTNRQDQLEAGRLLSRKEAAAALGVGEQTVADLRRRGLPAVRLGRCYKYPAKLLAQFLRENSINWTEPQPDPLPAPPVVDPDSPTPLLTYALVCELRQLRRMVGQLVGRQGR